MKYFGSLPDDLDDKVLKKIGIGQKKINAKYLQRAREVLAKHDLDAERDIRLEKCLCKNCHYIEYHHIGGSAMTSKNCKRCNTLVMYSSTDTDLLCKTCSADLKICKRCLQAID